MLKGGHMRALALAALPAILMVTLGVTHAADPAGGKHLQLTLRVDQQTPGIDLSEYALITDHPEAHRREAEAIMRVKLGWPRAVQTKDPAVFNRILARGFTLREPDGRLYERDAYIRDRVESREAVKAVRYENVVLQFIGDVAVMSYRNVLRHTNADGTPDTLYLSWLDVFVREQGEWKIGASHLISERVERTSVAANNEMQRASYGQVEARH
jgi:hypothetical protein